MYTLTEVERIAFENEVKHQYQAVGSALETTVRLKNAPQPGTYKFRKFGKLDMVPRGAFKSLLSAIETNHELVSCTAEDYVLPVLTDEFEQSHTGGEAPQEQREAAMAIAWGMKRQRDYSVIAALDASTPELTPITAGSGMTVAICREALKQFDKYEMRAGGDPVGGGRVYTLITENQHDDLLADSLTQSIDTSNFRSLVDAKISEFVGHNFILIGTGRGSLGLPVPSARTCFSYVKSAVGQAVCIEPKVKTSYELMMVSDATVGMLSVGSVVIDTAGFVQYNVTES